MIYLQNDAAQGFSRQPLKYILITLIVLLTLVKLNLSGAGFLALPDEKAGYYASGKALKCFSEFKIKDAFESIFSIPGRPAEGILKTIPNAVQVVTAYLGKINYYESANSYPLFFYNYIVYCLLLFVHYRFSKFLFNESYLALISVILFSSLTNSYLYLRHALPYDASLLIFYLVIYKIVTDKNDSISVKASFLFGISSFLGYLVYPGYFPLYILALTIFFFNKVTLDNVFQKIVKSIYFGLGSLMCLIFFEGLSRLGGHSYLSDSKNLSMTITQGSFEESFIFIVKYLSEVEGGNGIIMIISLTIFFLLMIFQLMTRRFARNQFMLLIGISVTVLFLMYACVGYFLHKMVFYGRLLHQYLPFICIFSVYALNEILQKVKLNQILLFIVTIFFIINFAIKFKDYNSYSYPRDISWKLSKTVNMRDIEIECEYEDGYPITPIMEAKVNQLPLNNSPGIPEVILVNSCLMFPVTDISKFHKFNPEENYTLAEFSPHFLNFKAYQYEGYSIEERSIMDQLNLQIKVFRKNKTD